MKVKFHVSLSALFVVLIAGHTLFRGNQRVFQFLLPDPDDSGTTSSSTVATASNGIRNDALLDLPSQQGAQRQAEKLGQPTSTSTTTIARSGKSKHEDLSGPSGVQAIPEPEPLSSKDRKASSIKENSSHVKTTADAKRNTPPKLEDFRLCRVKPSPTEGKPPVEMRGLAMPVEYQCAGEPYQQFASLLKELIFNHQTNVSSTSSPNSKTNRWGKRRRIIPDGHPNQNPNQNQNLERKQRAVLIMGNSHTRQLVSTLLCQYREQIISHQMLYSIKGIESYGVRQFQLRHNLTIYAATNCPFVYAEKWYQVLETNIIKRPLQSLDAIVLGRFNHLTESTGTKFYKIMMRYQQEYPNMGIDFERYAGPTVANVADIYKGPIVWVGMFSKYGNAPHREAKTMIQAMEQGQDPYKAAIAAAAAAEKQSLDLHQETLNSNARRTNLRAIHGRYYIEQLLRLRDANKKKSPTTNNNNNNNSMMLPVEECSSDRRDIVTTCIVNTTSYRHQNGHRCMGDQGGHPDLIVWDLVEALHELLATK